ncbi:MAG: polysulfide reductase NrfD [Chloroflexi bacterium]|nr:polysulfide reductase NrfD [Chloroflexota bacterium]
MLKKISYAVGALALLFGLWGVYVRLFEGEQSANYGSYIGWGLWVAMYLFLAGLAAGAYMLAAFEYLFNVPQFKGTGKTMLWAALVTLPAGLASIGMDLGHIDRIWKVYLQPNFNSFLALMVWGYTIFLILIALSLYFAFKSPEKAAMKVVMWIGFVTSILVAGGVGFLLGGNAARLYWHVGLLPVQFPVFAIASGAGLMLLIVGWFMSNLEEKQRSDLLWTLAIVTIATSVAKLYFLVADYTQSLYGGVTDNLIAVNYVLNGPHAFMFWGVQIVLGLLIPVIVLAQPKLAKNGFIAGLMGLFLLIGYAAARILIVVPGQVAEMMPGQAEAFVGPKLTLAYTPSLMEWSVTSAVFGFAILGILIGMDYLLNRMPRSTEVKK